MTIERFKAASIANTVNDAMAEFYRMSPNHRGVISEDVALILSMQTKAKVAAHLRCPVCIS